MKKIANISGSKSFPLRVASFWLEYNKNKAAVAALVLFMAILMLTSAAALLTPFGPLNLVANPFLPPSQSHPMGTDNLGRDMLSGVLYGTRTSLEVGIFGAAISVILGVLIGAPAGYYGGFIDDFLMRVTEFFQVIPNLFLALAVVAVVGGSFWNITWVIGLTSWPTTSRLVRAEFLSLRERSFVEAARGFGASTSGLIFEEILPNATAPVIVNGTFQVSRAILLEAGLAYLGLEDPNVPSLGRLIEQSQPYLSNIWWMAVFPGIFIALIVLAMNLIGDGLNDALNPRLRER